MNTMVTLRKAAGSAGPENLVPTTRFKSCPTMAGLWLALALLAGGISFPSRAAAQDASWQDDPQPKRRARAVQQAYPDDELPSRTVAASDETPAIPVAPGSVTSPSSKPAPKRRAAGEAAPADGDLPARAAPPARRPMAIEEGSPMAPAEPFANPDEEGLDNDFGYRGPPLREILSNRLWFSSEALLWWAKGGETPPLLTTSPAPRHRPKRACWDRRAPASSLATRN